MSSQPQPNAQAIFYQQYEAVRRDELVGILLALFLGGLGIHHFYLRRTGLGILYLCFFWTWIPCVAGLYRVLLHAWPGAGVQRHSGGGNRGGAGDCAAGLGPAPVGTTWPPTRLRQRIPPVCWRPAATAGRPTRWSARFCSGCRAAL
jgi:hypothetical protein